MWLLYDTQMKNALVHLIWLVKKGITFFLTNHRRFLNEEPRQAKRYFWMSSENCFLDGLSCFSIKHEPDEKRNTLIKSCIYPSDVPPVLILTEKESGQNKSQALLCENLILYIYVLDDINYNLRNYGFRAFSHHLIDSHVYWQSIIC